MYILYHIFSPFSSVKGDLFMSNLAEKIGNANKQIWFQHNDADGFITIAKKDVRTGRFHQQHYRANELAEHLSAVIGEDVFYSQNTFYKPFRRIENIRQLRSLYVDLDFYIFNYDPNWILGKLEYEFYQESIPEPNMIIFSGQGVVLIWLIEPVPYQALPLWQAVQNYLINQLKPLGGDVKAADAARVFRLAGSTSSKNGAEVRVEYRHNTKYVLREIQDDYLPELTPRPAKVQKPKGRKKKIAHLFNVYSLHHARLLDLTKLIEMRDGEVDGMREVMCFLYRYWTCCFTGDAEEALQQTIEFNQTFKHPLRQKEVQKATESAEKAWKAKDTKEANEAARALGYPGAGYHLTNAKLIDWLDISPEEQEVLSTIIGQAEKNRRSRIKYKENPEPKKQKVKQSITKTRRKKGIRPMEEYNQERTNKRLLQLKQLKKHINENPKLSNKKLAELMQVSESTIKRLKKEFLFNSEQTGYRP